MSDTNEVLKRLLRRIGREAGKMERWSDSAWGRGAAVASEKYAGQANVLRMVQGFVRAEMRKAKKP